MRIISYVELKRMISDNNTVLIDVRDREDYTAGHLFGAINIEFDELELRLRNIRYKRIIFVCERGNTSLKAANIAVRMGIEAYSLVGGYRSLRNTM